jgi:hypothetical protein
VVLALLAAPAGWAASALDPRSDGSVLDASTGPSRFFDLVAPPVAAASRARIEGVPGGGSSIGEGPPNPQQRLVLDYLEAHRGGATYLVATESVALTTLYVRESGQPVLLVGGFSGLTPFPTLAGFQGLVATGRLRYVVEPAGGGTDTTRDRIAAWVLASCQPVAGADGTPLAVQGGVVYACGRSSDPPSSSAVDRRVTRPA